MRLLLFIGPTDPKVQVCLIALHAYINNWNSILEKFQHILPKMSQM